MCRCMCTYAHVYRDVGSRVKTTDAEGVPNLKAIMSKIRHFVIFFIAAVSAWTWRWCMRK